MSYCRWSTDNFNCDLYAYQSDRGYIIHVCAGKYSGDIPKNDMSFLDSGTKEDIDKYLQTSKVQSDYLKTCGTEPIGLPYDGETFELETIEDFYNKMQELIKVGYRCPESVLEGIKDEINEQTKTE